MCFLVQNRSATPVFSLLTAWTPLCHCNVRNPPDRGSQPSALLSLRRGSSAIPVRDDKEQWEWVEKAYPAQYFQIIERCRLSYAIWGIHPCKTAEPEGEWLQSHICWPRRNRASTWTKSKKGSSIFSSWEIFGCPTLLLDWKKWVYYFVPFKIVLIGMSLNPILSPWGADEL